MSASPGPSAATPSGSRLSQDLRPSERATDAAAAAVALGFTSGANDTAPADTAPAEGATNDALVDSATCDPDDRVRSASLGALVRRARALPSSVDVGAVWERSLGDPAARVRRRAAELAADGSFPAGPLIGLLDDDEMLVAEAAAAALGELGSHAIEAGAVGALARIATDHGEPLVRESAVAALGSLGHPDGLAAILAGCRDRPAIRRRAVLALAPFDGPEVDAAIERASNDKDWQVRQAADDMLGATGSGT